MPCSGHICLRLHCVGSADGPQVKNRATNVGKGDMFEHERNFLRCSIRRLVRLQYVDSSQSGLAGDLARRVHVTVSPHCPEPLAADRTRVRRRIRTQAPNSLGNVITAVGLRLVLGSLHQPCTAGSILISADQPRALLGFTPSMRWMAARRACGLQFVYQGARGPLSAERADF